MTDYRGRLFKDDKALALPLGFTKDVEHAPLRIAAVVHLYYEDTAYEILSYLHHLPRGADVYVTTTSARKLATIKPILENYTSGKVETRIVPNRGRDVSARLLGFPEIYQNYDLVLNLHSKRSLHNTGLEAWRTFLFETLCGSREIVHDIVSLFQFFPNVGLIFPQHLEYIRQWVSWTGNFDASAALAARMGMGLDPSQAIDFPAGSMYWVRTAAIKPLIDLGLSFDDFEVENRQADNTLAHAIERLMAIVCEGAGYDWLKVGCPAFYRNEGLVTAVESHEDLNAFVADNTVRITGEQKLAHMYDCRSTQYTATDSLREQVERNKRLIKGGKDFYSWTQAGPVIP